MSKSAWQHEASPVDALRTNQEIRQANYFKVGEEVYIKASPKRRYHVASLTSNGIMTAWGGFYSFKSIEKVETLEE